MSKLPRVKPLTRFVAMSSAVLLLASGCNLPGLTSKAGNPAPGETSAPTASNQVGTEYQQFKDFALAKINEVGSAMGIDGDPISIPEYAKYYKQNPSWKPCDVKMQSGTQANPNGLCGTIKVPKVWNHPEKGDIDLALVKIPALGTPKGSIVVNYGGPGGGGVRTTLANATQMFPVQLREKFDIISFDPRGVDESAPVTCLPQDQLDKFFSSNEVEGYTGKFDDIDKPGELAKALEAAKNETKKLGSECLQRSPEILGNIDTWSAARDLDLIRSALSEDKLDYLGYSYGTYLGASYAELYPDRTGKLILDGAVDPTLNWADLSYGQTLGFEASLKEFMRRCSSDTCPFKGSTEEKMQQLMNFLKQIEKQPMKAEDGRELTLPLAIGTVVMPLYNDSMWTFAQQAFGKALQGDPSQLLLLSDLLMERNPDGTYLGNMNFANGAINCLDRPALSDPKQQEELGERLIKDAPHMGKIQAVAGAACQGWPKQAVRTPAPIHAKNTPTIVVIGTVHDPATPYSWAVAMDKQLENSVLLTYEGWGHTAYGRSGGCIERAVNDYLIDDKVPETGLRCK